MRAFVISFYLVLIDQVLRLSSQLRHWPLAGGPHLIHLSGQPELVFILGAGGYFLGFRPGQLGWLMLLSGSGSNLLSSFQPGGVLDYIPCGYFYTNSADLLITGGAIWMILDLLRRRS